MDDSKEPLAPNQHLTDAFCKTCGEETAHVLTCAGHERDSSGDYRECLECGERVFGFEREF